MKLGAIFNSVQIDLDQQDQLNLKELIELQEAKGDFKYLGMKVEAKTILGIPWKKLKHIVMVGEKSCKYLRIPLDEHQQILLKRYIDAERLEPDFIEKGLEMNFLNEVFFYFYFAGHGCADN